MPPASAFASRAPLLALAILGAFAALTFKLATRPRSAPAPPAPIAAPAANAAPSAPDAETLLARLDVTTTPALASASARLRLAPRSSDAWLRLGDLLADRARLTLDPALYATVEQIYLQAYKLDATNTAALVGLAWAAGAAHRFDDSVAWATLALRADPDQPEAHGLLGDAALELGRPADAELHYERMQALRPGVSSYARSAHLLYLQGHPADALALMRRALAAAGGDPGPSAWCVAALATMLCRENDSPAALALVTTWRKKIPDDVALLHAAGATHAALGQDALALAAYERALALQPQHATFAALHELHLAAGRPADAALVVERIEALARTHHAQGLQGGEGALARFYADAGLRPAEAVRLAEAEYTHHRGPVPAATLAWALHRAGRTAEAAKLLPAFTTDRPPEPALHYYAATIAEAAGDPETAARHYAAALARQPRWSPVQTPLATAALLRLRPDHALAASAPSP